MKKKLTKKLTKKQFRQFLNAQDTTKNYRNHRYHQKTRLYGDYLYNQDKARFDYYFEVWKKYGKEWERYL